MIGMPVTVGKMGHMMNILPLQAVSDVFRSVKEQFSTSKETLGPLREYLPPF